MNPTDHLKEAVNYFGLTLESLMSIIDSTDEEIGPLPRDDQHRVLATRLDITTFLSNLRQQETLTHKTKYSESKRVKAARNRMLKNLGYQIFHSYVMGWIQHHNDDMVRTLFSEGYSQVEIRATLPNLGGPRFKRIVNGMQPPIRNTVPETYTASAIISDPPTSNVPPTTTHAISHNGTNLSYTVERIVNVMESPIRMTVPQTNTTSAIISDPPTLSVPHTSTHEISTIGTNLSSTTLTNRQTISTTSTEITADDIITCAKSPECTVPIINATITLRRSNRISKKC